ncbi:MAG: AAA family ATPase [Desulfobulbaceae bacterium]|nr:AAA family ATPase [Desulfobulbaceae bacterium]
MLQPLSLINSLMQPEIYDPPVGKCVLIETHISWVILAGPYAYKIKKSIDLGFLDFSTLEKRHFYCQEELRLNKRLAPATYLSVLPITGTVENPQWAGKGDAIEYAIKMQAFPQKAQLDRVLANGELQARQIDLLARHIANFHDNINIAELDSSYGDPELILQPVEENFRQIREHVKNADALHSLAELEGWSKSTFNALQALFRQRKAAGFIRECHGDMHLRNIAWVDDAPLVFDCIEFSPGLRWIDVINDIAFLVMDLQDRKQPILALRFLDNYLQLTGDYSSLAVLQFYLVYRALVRAKIDAIRAHQAGISRKEQAEAEKEFSEYLNLALNYIRAAKPQLIITRGMSASGKSTVSQTLMEQLGAVRIRSDVERKRLFGPLPEEDGQSGVGKVGKVGKGIYTAEATDMTYRKLEGLAAQILDAGYSVIVDAVFLNYAEREQFRKLAESRQVSFVILECHADAEILRQRIVQRKKGVSDADLEILAMQCSKWQPLHKDEHINTVPIDTSVPVDIPLLAMQIKANK